MKQKFKISLVLSLIMLALVFVLGGCTLQKTKEQIMAENNLTAQVTYYINGYDEKNGKLSKANFDPSKLAEISLYYTTGSVPYNIQEKQGAISVVFDKHTFVGWYEVECDENGKPIVEHEFTETDKNGKETKYYTYKLAGEATFSPLQEGERRHYAAKWETDTHVNVNLVLHGEEEGELPIDTAAYTGEKKYEAYEYEPLKGQETIANGGLLLRYSYRNGTVGAMSPDIVPVKDKAYTFVGYYTDEACTQPIPQSIAQEETDVTVYAQYIKGSDWVVVSTAAGSANSVEQIVKQASNAKARFILSNDIDCSQLKASSGNSLSAIGGFACEVQGNGFTLKNLTLEKGQSGAQKSLLGAIRKTAIIADITFENLTFSAKFKRQSDYNEYYFLFTSLHEEATVKNVKVNGGNMVMYNDVEYVPLVNVKEKINYIFGGYETDEAYTTQSNGEGFSVIGEITIKTEQKESFTN